MTHRIVMLMKILAILMLLSGAAVSTGAALEFAYFGPGTPQFVAGLVATPAGILAVSAEQVCGAGDCAPEGWSWLRPPDSWPARPPRPPST
jgi:hypothetical protein